MVASVLSYCTEIVTKSAISSLQQQQIYFLNMICKFLWSKKIFPPIKTFQSLKHFKVDY